MPKPVETVDTTNVDTTAVDANVNDNAQEQSTDAGTNGKLDIELFKTEIEKNEEFKNEVFKVLSPDIDARVSKGINTFKTNYDIKVRENNDAEVEKLYQERHPGEDPKDKLIRQANEKAELALKKQEKAESAKHLSLIASNKNINLNEKLLDMFAEFGNDEGEMIINEFAKTRLDGMEEGRNKTLNKHAKTPQAGDSVNTEIPVNELIQAWTDGKISEEEYQRRVKSLK